MALALEEAQKGVGKTHPNPMVGCVIVKGGEVIARGYHARAGTAHAEIVALKRAGARAKGADAYVTLEPCDHVGRTGPCTEALIEAGVKRVFVAMRDPHKIVYGRGFRTLRKAGIEVQVGLLNEECVRLNEDYVHYLREGRPFVVAKMAQSIDGKVATRARHSKWITSEKARRFGQKLRHRCDAILVGVETVLADDPRLTCRLRGGQDPIRIVLDSHARTPVKAEVVRAASTSGASTVVVVGEDAPPRRVRALTRAGAEVLSCPLLDGRIDLPALMGLLGERGILSVLIEGGPTVMGSFFDADLVQKVYAFVAPLVIGGEQAKGAVGGIGPATLVDASRLVRVTTETIGDDLLIIGYCGG